MLTYLGMMLLETGVLIGALKALSAIPVQAQEVPTQFYLGVRSSPVGTISSFLLNLLYWVLWLGTGYLLFFWKKPMGIAAPHE